MYGNRVSILFQPRPPEAPEATTAPVATAAQTGSAASAKVQGDKGLPSWFGLYCATTEGGKTKPASREEKPARVREEAASKHAELPVKR